MIFGDKYELNNFLRKCLGTSLEHRYIAPNTKTTQLDIVWKLYKQMLYNEDDLTNYLSTIIDGCSDWCLSAVVIISTVVFKRSTIVCTPTLNQSNIINTNYEMHIKRYEKNFNVYEHINKCNFISADKKYGSLPSHTVAIYRNANKINKEFIKKTSKFTRKDLGIKPINFYICDSIGNFTFEDDVIIF